jgi:hypothetical protein
MANVSVPIDGRPQFDPSTVMISNALAGRWLTAGVETVTPGGKYILRNSWPPAPRASGGGNSPARPVEVPDAAAPKLSSEASRALWPNLK